MYKQKRNDLCRCGSNKKYKKCCLIIYQSPMYKQKLNLGRSGYDVVKKYVELPILPRGIEITIGSIGVLNWDSDERRPCDELFPQKIFIDNRNEWMSELMYMVRIRIQK